MSVYIKGMEMPESCIFCPAMNGDWSICKLTGRNINLATRQTDCPLIPVPDHWRLIDKAATNADRIRAMSDEELAKLLAKSCVPDDRTKCIDWLEGETIEESCTRCCLDWLKKEATE